MEDKFIHLFSQHTFFFPHFSIFHSQKYTKYICIFLSHTKTHTQNIHTSSFLSPSLFLNQQKLPPHPLYFWQMKLAGIRRPPTTPAVKHHCHVPPYPSSLLSSDLTTERLINNPTSTARENRLDSAKSWFSLLLRWKPLKQCRPFSSISPIIWFIS